MSIKSTQSKILIGLLASAAWTGAAQAQTAPCISYPHDIGYDSKVINKNGISLITTAPALQLIGYQPNGSNGDDGGPVGRGHDGDPGGTGGSVYVLNCAALQTFGQGSHGIYALSPGGNGGHGGSGGWVDTRTGDGANGGRGGSVWVDTNTDSQIQTYGDHAHGIYAYSLGGSGGRGGDGTWFDTAGYGAIGGNSGQVVVNNNGSVVVSGVGSNGIYSRSEGGHAGDGGSGGFFFGTPGNGGEGGSAGGTAFITNTGSIYVAGKDASGLLLESIGGQGGSGGNQSNLFVALGASGGIGGNASAVFGRNSGVIETREDNAKGISAQSIGGGGGHGGDAFNYGAFGGLAIGGSAGGGGHADVATIYNSGNILTGGVGSHGMMANSVGGGGGDGGRANGVTIGYAAAFQVSIGGSGGSGGNGGNATVLQQSPSSIRTGLSSYGNYSRTAGVGVFAGDMANGILSQSVGGGGGSGGRALAVAASGSFNTPSISVAVGIGGSGGSGGNGGTSNVTVEQGSSVTTSGRFADAVVSQSIGGGGGKGGSVITVAAAVAEVAGVVSVGVGGSGGLGGHGGQVSLTNGGNISTFATMSNGLVARSIGGGGGSGGNVVDVAASAGKNSATFAVNIGGSGGEGGDSSQVTLNNTGTVATQGNKSHGIFAQSVGGGGGSGGNAHTYAVSAIAGGQGGGLSLAAGVSVGGVGGTGNTASNVILNNGGQISTMGDASHGVFMQSVGGGGGEGGDVIGISIAASLDVKASNGTATGGRPISATVSVGGNGGHGGTAGHVIYNGAANSSITTNGVRSHGVFAQSTGGGGGNAGHAYSYDISTSIPTSAARFKEIKSGFASTLSKLTPGSTSTPSSDPASSLKDGLAASVTVGGNGGTGNHADLVSLSFNVNTQIDTADSQSHGIFAQSVGGGGGSGGYAYSNGFAGVDSYGLTLAIGGKGGASGDGGEVNIYTAHGAGYIKTRGTQAHGVFAQSVGGGGGEGGHATAAMSGIPLILSKKSLSIALGGSGGSTGHGDTVKVDHNQDISTSGDAASGIIAQSVGGGGGHGAGAMAGGLLEFSLGGKGGSSGDGGAVSVIGMGNISTQGQTAHGLIAQSVGGGGGIGGAASGDTILGFIDGGLDAGIKVHLGGSGGGGGDGGLVTVSRSGSITTNGDTAIGILAQSVGGGGGIATNSTLRIVYGDIPIMGGVDGATGNGGDVKINSHGGTLDITTNGKGAHGIFAQSVGGGGGIVVTDDAAGFTLKAAEPIANSTGKNVTIDHVGSILTRGDNANGIYAQSLSSGLTMLSANGAQQFNLGQTMGRGVVSIKAGSIQTLGNNSHGIIAINAHQTGSTYWPAIDIDITGKVEVTGAGSWGIHATNGYSGSVLTSETAGSRVNVRAGASIISTRQGGGGIQLNEYVGSSTVNVAGLLNAGHGTAIQAAGALSLTVARGGEVFGDVLHGTGLIYGTYGPAYQNFIVENNGVIRGSTMGADYYVLGNNARHWVGVDPMGIAGGTGGLTTKSLIIYQYGEIIPYLKSLPTDSVPFQKAVIVSADTVEGETLDDTFLFKGQSLSTLFEYEMTDTSVTVTGVTVDFENAGLQGNDGTLATLANSMLGAWTANIANTGNASLNDVLLRAANTGSETELAQIFEDFDSSTHYSTGGFVIGSNQYDLGHMQSCGSATGTFAAIKESNCNWAKVIYADSELRDGDQKHQATTIAFGRQKETSPGMFLGYSAGYESNDYDGKNSSAKGHRVFVGGIAKRLDGPLLLSASATAGYGWSDGQRIVAATGAEALSEHKTMSLATRLRGVYLVEVGPINVMPMAELDMSLIHDKGYRETGAGVFNLQRHAKTHFVADLRPALRVGTDINVGPAVLRGYVEGGARFALNDLTHEVHLPDAPQEHDTANLKMGRDEVVGTFAAGLSVLSGDRFEIGARYEASKGKQTMSHTGGVKLGFKF